MPTNINRTAISVSKAQSTGGRAHANAASSANTTVVSGGPSLINLVKGIKGGSACNDGTAVNTVPARPIGTPVCSWAVDQLTQGPLAALTTLFSLLGIFGLKLGFTSSEDPDETLKTAAVHQVSWLRGQD